jgi:hypothetical protein
MTKNNLLKSLLSQYETLEHYINSTDDVTPETINKLTYTEAKINQLLNN